MDISDFDFEVDALQEISDRLAPLASAIELEPRLHRPEESAAVHPQRSAPTFRIRFRERPGDGLVRALASLETDLGLATVTDRDGSIRLRRVSTYASTAE